MNTTPPRESFSQSMRGKFRAQVEVFVDDILWYCRVWAGIFVAHAVRKLAALAGIDNDVINNIWTLEKLALYATFGSYFVRLGVTAMLGIFRKGEP